MLLPVDGEVVNALRNGDEVVFEKVFRHYYKLLCNYAMGIVNDHDEAEDTVQQTMIRIWEKRETLEISASLKSYLYRAVHNAALNKLRQAKVRTLYAEEQVATTVAMAEPSSHKIIKSELEQEISKAINKLPEQCRLVFKLSRFEHLKYAEIADHLDISVKTVENHMGKALRMMRENLKDYLVWVILFMPSLF